MLSPRRDHRLDNKTRIANIRNDISKIKKKLAHLSATEKEMARFNERVIDIENQLLLIKDDSNAQEKLTILYANTTVLMAEINRFEKGKAIDWDLKAIDLSCFSPISPRKKILQKSAPTYAIDKEKENVKLSDSHPSLSRSNPRAQAYNTRHCLFAADKISNKANANFTSVAAIQLESSKATKFLLESKLSSNQQNLINLCKECVRFIELDEYWYAQNKHKAKTVGEQIKNFRKIIAFYKEMNWENNFIVSARLLADLSASATQCLKAVALKASGRGMNIRSGEYMTKSTIAFINLLKISMVAYYVEGDAKLCINENVAKNEIIDLFEFIEKRRNIRNKVAYFLETNNYEAYMGNKFVDKNSVSKHKN